MVEFEYRPLFFGAFGNQSLSYPLFTWLSPFDTTRHDEQRWKISNLKEKTDNGKKLICQFLPLTQ
jgi:hypothetical protein